MAHIYILAGGKSLRMGEDKGLKLLHGKPIVQYVIEQAKQCSVPVFMVSNQDAYRQFGEAVIPDLIEDVGPIGGIYTGLMHSTASLNLFIACDMPFISAAWLGYMLAQVRPEDSIIVPTWQGQLQPLCGLYARSCLPYIEKALAEKDYKMMRFIGRNPHRLVSVEESGIDGTFLFENINTPNDFEAARAFFSQ